MRNRLAPLASVAVAAALISGGCAAAAPPPDAYQQVATSARTAWDSVQVNIGINVTVAGETIKVDPKDIAIVLDSAGGKGAIHVALAAAEFGVPPSALETLGIDGDSLDFDLVYTGDALFIKSAMLAPTLRLFLGPVGKLPAGDLTGWLKLGTKDELAALGAMSGAAVRPPSAAPSAEADPAAAMKATLEAVGVTLAIVGTEKHNGADLQRIKIAVDTAKLMSNPSFLTGAGNGPQAAQSLALLKTLSFGGDLWLDAGSHRLVETDLHIGSATDATVSGDVIVTAHDPDGSVSLEAPSSAVDVPIAPLFAEMMKLITKGAES